MGFVMGYRLTSLVMCVMTLLVGGEGATTDLTLERGAAGREVVEAVLAKVRDSCIFADDRLFLRRLAYVETKDGTDPQTYRPGYDGGIWQVDQDKFLHTQRNASLLPLHRAILSHFGITWSAVTWSDLRKPLYSGLAAWLYFTSALSGDVMPGKTGDQEALYALFYRPSLHAAEDFNVKVTHFENPVCSQSRLDLVFVVDSSSSISLEDFQVAKQFTTDVISKVRVGPNDVRVAYVTFSSAPEIQFRLDTFSTVSDVIGAINGVNKREGGTATAEALESVSRLLQDKGGGLASPGWWCCSLTAWQTTEPARRWLHGSCCKRALSSSPSAWVPLLTSQSCSGLAPPATCSHVSMADTYSSLDHLIAKIQSLACNAPLVLGGHNSHQHSFGCGETHLFQMIDPMAMVTVSVKHGAVQLYASLKSSPNMAYYDFRALVTDGLPVLVFLENQTSPLFLNVSAPQSCLPSFQYTVSVTPPSNIPPDTHLICVANNVARNCSVMEVLSVLYNITTPHDLLVPQAWPCQGTEDFYPFPHDPSKFIYCDKGSVGHVIQCPGSQHYEPKNNGCVPRNFRRF